ncbi:signal peptidase I [Candidatus Microgenomates bacterium]|nr:signal peptidase I [Candidatus Microgenomates bacterium]
MFARLGAFILDILQVVVFAVAIFLFVYLLVLQPHKIKGQSMDPNFKDGEFLLTDKVTYRFREPKRGDVIVFKAPPDDHDEYIKRIIGLPGDTVMVQGGKVFVSGQQLTEKYLDPNLFTAEGNFLHEGTTETVPQGTYLVMGDNRPHSFDGRAFGPIKKEKITGRAWLVYWPPQKAGVVPEVNYGF